MADAKISALTETTTLDDTDDVILARSGANFRLTGANLKAAAGGGSIEAGALIWAWNRTDVTEFESTAHVFEANGGGAPLPGDFALSVVPEATHGVIGVGNALQVVGTTFAAGGGIFGVLTSATGTLPDRFVMVINWLEGTTTPVFSLAALGYTDDDGGGDAQGFYIEKQANTSNNNIRVIVNNEEGGASGSMHNGGSWDAAVVTNGGVFQTLTIFNTTPATPAVQRVLAKEFLPDLSDEVGFDGQLPHLIGSVGTNWDGVDLNRVGIGMRHGAGGTQTGTLRIADIRIYAHPWD